MCIRINIRRCSPSRLDDISPRHEVLEVASSPVGHFSLFSEGEHAVQTAHFELLVDVGLSQKLVTLDGLHHDSLEQVLVESESARRRHGGGVIAARPSGSRVGVGHVVVVLPEVLLHHQGQTILLRDPLQHGEDNQELVYHDPGSALCQCLQADSLPQVEVVLVAERRLIDIEVVLRKHYLHEIVLNAVVFGTRGADAIDQFICVDGGAHEDATRFESGRDVLEIRPQLLLRLEHVVNSELSRNQVKDYLLLDVLQTAFGP